MSYPVEKFKTLKINFTNIIEKQLETPSYGQGSSMIQAKKERFQTFLKQSEKNGRYTPSTGAEDIVEKVNEAVRKLKEPIE